MYRLAPTTHALALAVGKSVLITVLVGVLYGILELMRRPNAFVALAVFVLLALALAVRLLRGPRP